MKSSKCQTCGGWGWIYVQGGAPDERIPDTCPDCDGTGVQTWE